MLGILIALLAATGIVALTLIHRELPLYGVIAIFIIAAEQGEGFTSSQGSIFFNQQSLHLAGLKLIEVILYSYAGTLILLDLPIRRKRSPSSLRRLYWLWIAWLVVLVVVQFDVRGSIDFIIFRGVVFGWTLLYVFTSMIESRMMVRRVILFTFILLTVKALWLMLMFVAGRGDRTPRGYSPIFWDEKLLEACVWMFLVFFVSIVQPRSERNGWSPVWASVGVVLLVVLIALSLRRNYLGQVAIGVVFVLFYTGHRVQMQRFLSLALIGAILLGIVFTAGQIIGDRLPLIRQLTEYVQMLNFASPDFAERPANQVHLFNVKTYTALLSEYEGIRLFGKSAAPTKDYRNFNREYLSYLGLAHNGPLRAIFDFGIGGLVIWAGFFYLTFRAMLRCQFNQLEPWEQALVIGSAAAVFAHFVVTLAVIPPFFTTFKILFFFLFMVYVVEFYGREGKIPEAQTVGVTPSLGCADSYTPA